MRRRSLLPWMLLLILAEVGLSAEKPADHHSYLFVATYSPQTGEGIFVTPVASDGTTGPLKPTGNLQSPAALAVHPQNHRLYATTLITRPDGTSTGGVVAFAIDPATGMLREIDRRASGGSGPCYLSTDSAGRCLLIAHCGSANIASISLESEGDFGEFKSFMQHAGESRNSEGKPQAHSILVSPDDRFAIAADLGLDRLFVYRLQAEAACLAPHDPASVDVCAGSGPRHLAFRPDGCYLYSVNELDNSITACRFDSKCGTVQPFQHLSTLPKDFAGESYAAEIRVHPTGRFVYASNRGHDSLAVFQVNADTGRLSLIQHQPSGGLFPRHFEISRDGQTVYVANQKSHQLAAFRVDIETGMLKSANVTLSVPQPVWIKLLSETDSR